LGQVWATTALADAVAGATILAVSVLEALRAELERARSSGAPFADAWSPGTAVVLAALGRGESSDWGGVLTATAGAWRARPAASRSAA
jgi:hypothetical protein